QSCASPNIMINTIVAESLDEICTYLEGLKKEDFNAGLQKKLNEIVKKHKRIIFNGDGYDSSWIKEAEKRGLPNLKSTPEALKPFTLDENIKLFEKYGVFNRAEMLSRYEVFIEEYERKVHIEAGIAINIAKTMILPAVARHIANLSAAANSPWKNKDIDAEGKRASELLSQIAKASAALSKEFAKAKNEAKTISAMAELRKAVDEAETVVEDSLWPLPKYRELLFIY
ncbi:MAG: hypothetical protein J6P03_01205, partial [Opitutales bacterium]|nr:hypothetical protein [Opitutales bacterium]